MAHFHSVLPRVAQTNVQCSHDPADSSTWQLYAAHSGLWGWRVNNPIKFLEWTVAVLNLQILNPHESRVVVLRSTGFHGHVNWLTLRRWPFASISNLHQLSLVQKNRARTPGATEVTADKHRAESCSCSGPTAFALQSSPGSKFYSTRSYRVAWVIKKMSTQKGGALGWEWRWGGTGGSRWRGDYNSDILCEKNIYLQ